MNAQLDTQLSARTDSTLAFATFGAGCFWHTEEVFRTQPGVVRTSVGYMGGHCENPCYLDVLARITGHAEVAQIQYDPAIASYETLLALFWACHDPTTLNRQGPDRGEQYRSVIFCHTSIQLKAAQDSKAQLDASDRHLDPIVTQIQAASDYWLASEEHQQYLFKKSLKRPQQ
ncbi:MAG: peptide-methionine (S)-S-oxide reductase MsrA [Phormidesmis sp.]